jgi:hypothetical protein
MHEEIKSKLKLVNVFYHLVFTKYCQGDQMRLRLVWHVRGKGKMRTGLWWGNLKERSLRKPLKRWEVNISLDFK